MNIVNFKKLDNSITKAREKWIQKTKKKLISN